MLLIKVAPYVLGVIPGAPEPRMYLRSGYFLAITKIHFSLLVTYEVAVQRVRSSDNLKANLNYGIDSKIQGFQDYLLM